MQQLEKPVDWYDVVCHRLDLLQAECLRDKQSGNDMVPSQEQFQAVKLTIEKLRQLAGFPSKLPDADVWIGPESQIGLTWEFDEDRSIDLVFAPATWAARYTDDVKQEAVKPQELPVLLAKLAA